MPIRPLILSDSKNHRAGFTLIEILVVIAIVGSILAIGMQLLGTVKLAQTETAGRLLLEKLFEDGRESSLRTGITYSMVLNLDNKTMGLRKFEADTEQNLDTEVSNMWIKQEQQALIEQETEEKNESKKEVSWIVSPVDLPADLESVYSLAGLPLTGPFIYMHFYPNGTSDSLIFYFKDRAKPYLVVPSHNLPAYYLSDLDITPDAPTNK